eukprot:Tamp_07493.p1 GENE.Tamp_07493~~Tamp_07493.p1  ORF type:complete len:636 (-),score=154.54 Tamp_07493:192-2099(-)
MSGKGSDKSSRKAKKTDEFASSSDDDYVEDEEQEAEKDWPSMHQPEGWLLETGHFSDVTVSCGPRTYKLHKAVLARESIFFRDKFLDPNEDEDPVLDYDDEDFEGLLAMIYMAGLFGQKFEDTVLVRMRELKIDPEKCLRVCFIADELGCGQVVLICRYYFDCTLGSESAIPFLRGSWGKPSLAYFKVRALDRMVTSFENYVGDDNIGILQVEALCAVMTGCKHREPKPPPDPVYCSIGVRNLVLQDLVREVNKSNIKLMLALLPTINFQEVCDMLIQCAKHGADQEMERCVPVLSAHMPDVDRAKTLIMPRKVILNCLRHEALSDMDYAYSLGKEYLFKETPELKAMIEKMDEKGVISGDKTKRPRVGTEEWYAMEILETLSILRNRIKRRDLELARNLPSFRILLICAEEFEDYRDDVRQKLVQAGCTQVDVVLANLRNPSLEQILTFHSVLIWSNADFHEPESLGDVLADAADEGIGVVLCAYCLKADDNKMCVGGRLKLQYLPVSLGYIEGGQELRLKANKAQLEQYPKCQPIMEGVTELSGGPESMHLTLERKYGVINTVQVADWSNRVPAVVAYLPIGKRKASIVVWNCRPGSSDVSAHGWRAGGHGQRLMFNMLRFATASPTEAKCQV